MENSFINNKNNYQDLTGCELLAKILTKELACLSLESEPIQFADVISNLNSEMALMPKIIQQCRQAAETFDYLDKTVYKMLALADRASELSDIPENNVIRLKLDQEFSAYSHIIARLADSEDNFIGTILSLKTLNDAHKTRYILKYLCQARKNFNKQLDAHRRKINDAMREALHLIDKISKEGTFLSHCAKETFLELADRLKTLSKDIFKQEKRNTAKLH